jgi:uncharacterized protein YndB with AHSA1/START domain
MLAEGSVEIAAPAATVWSVFTDVERWPEWTASVERLVALDGPGLDVGKRFAIKQTRLPNLVWQVTDVDPGVGWTWRQGSPGGVTTAVHELVVLSPERTLVRQGIEQRGPVGVAAGFLMRGMTRRYLQLEADGLKARCEQHA